MKTVGFTGSRKVMTYKQSRILFNLLQELKPDLVRHGDCIGSDALFHTMCLTTGIPIIIHPGNIPGQRAYSTGAKLVLDERVPLDRNRDIVNMSDVIIATPKERKAVLRSGTWMTIRYAKKVGKPIYIVSPDGELI